MSLSKDLKRKIISSGEKLYMLVIFSPYKINFSLVVIEHSLKFQ